MKKEKNTFIPYFVTKFEAQESCFPSKHHFLARSSACVSVIYLEGSNKQSWVMVETESCSHDESLVKHTTKIQALKMKQA